MESANQREIPEPTDTLGATLYSLRLNGLVYANSELSAPWGVDMPPMAGKMMFHIITQGGCWLRFPDHVNKSHMAVSISDAEMVGTPSAI